jgi:hypothetical protein
VWVVAGVVAILALLLLVGLGNVVGAPTQGVTAPDPVRSVAALTLPTLGDGLAINIAVGVVHSLLRDSITWGPGVGSHRSYTVTVTATMALPAVDALLTTVPLTEWAYPEQLPGGADSLPPLADWSWSVKGPSGAVDTSNWTVSRWGSELERTIEWTNHTFVISGSSTPMFSLNAWAPRTGGLETPAAALVLNPGSGWSGPSYPTYDPNYPALIQSLAPQFVRFSILEGAYSHWDTTTKSPVFNFSGVDQSFGLAKSTGVGVFYSLPIGTWGDGNLLPKGMPLNTNLPILGVTGPGYLPTPAAYQSYITTIVAHVAAMNESVLYWCVGNEMPLTNRTVVLAFIHLFNTAQRAIHAKFPTASVGTDVMMNRTYLGTFANLSQNVGFLSFHYYPDIGICIRNGTYCPPQGNPAGSLDSTLWASYASMADNHRFYPPSVAQSMWRNLTGRSIPVIDSESNLDGVGGSPLSNSNGTDPRQQTLVGAAWLASTLIEAAAQNVSSFTYFTLTGPNGTPPTITGPYGGFGYGMTSELPNGGHTLYSPYWAMRLFSRNFPAGSSGEVLSVPDPSVLRAYAIDGKSGLTVLIVNLDAVHVQVNLTENLTGLVPSHLKTLDKRSYDEQYNPSTDSTVVLRSGIRNSVLNPHLTTVPVSLFGYGLAVVHYVHSLGAALVSHSHGHGLAAARDRSTGSPEITAIFSALAPSGLATGWNFGPSSAVLPTATIASSVGVVIGFPAAAVVSEPSRSHSTGRK